MAAHDYLIWDMHFVNDVLTSRVERYTSLSKIDGNFYTQECPPGYQSIANGLVYVKDLKRCRREKPLVEYPLQLEGDRAYRRPERWHTGTLSLFAMLPIGYACRSLDHIWPNPVAFKVFNGRFAIYWRVGTDEHEFYWQLTATKPDSLEAVCRRLNSSLFKLSVLNRSGKSMSDSPAVQTENPKMERPDHSQSVAQRDRDVRAAVRLLLEAHPEGMSATELMTHPKVRAIVQYTDRTSMGKKLRNWVGFKCIGAGRNAKWVLAK